MTAAITALLQCFPSHSPGHLQCQLLENNTSRGIAAEIRYAQWRILCSYLCKNPSSSVPLPYTKPHAAAMHYRKTSCCYFLVRRISSCAQLTLYEIWEHASPEQNIAFHHSPESDASQNEMPLIHCVPTCPTMGIRERRMSAVAHSLARIGCILSLAILVAALRRLQDTSHCPHPVGPSHSRVTFFSLQHPGLKLGCEELGIFAKGWDIDVSILSLGDNPERQSTRLKFSPNHLFTRLIRESSK